MFSLHRSFTGLSSFVFVAYMRPFNVHIINLFVLSVLKKALHNGMIVGEGGYTL